jgi:transcriptional regulator with XRE-family HTH domain
MPQKKPYNYLRSYRKRAGVTQDELAFLLGRKSGTHVSRYELGRREPSLETLLALEAALGIPIRDLFRGRFLKVEQSIKERAILLSEKLGEKRKGRKRLRAHLADIYSRDTPPSLW